jgi:hypothetical protein
MAILSYVHLGIKTANLEKETWYFLVLLFALLAVPPPVSRPEAIGSL